MTTPISHLQNTDLNQHQSTLKDEIVQASKIQSGQTQQPSTKSLATTSRATRGTHPPPLMGPATVLVNNSALHLFGGRLETRELVNCHYVFDINTGYWQAIQLASSPSSNSNNTTHNNSSIKNTIDPTAALMSLSLTTDPVDTNSGSLSDALSISPCPRYFHTLNAYGTSLILFGGMGLRTRTEGEDSDNEGNMRQEQQSTSHLAALDDLHVFDIVTQRWQQKHPPVNQHSPRARWAHMATILDHFLVVIGGTDTNKAYVEDACVLDLHTWEWVASVQNIGQCGTYRTVAATGPSTESYNEYTPSTHSFPSVDAFNSPQFFSSNLSWPVATTTSTSSSSSSSIAEEEGTLIDAMASISLVLNSGRISAPSSTTSSDINHVETEEQIKKSNTSSSSSRKTSERLKSSELTPAFKAGKDLPSIYLYSNYNFQNLQREFKVILPRYIPSSSTPVFTLVDKTQTLDKMQSELPSGLRFPQGHIYQNQLILTGTLIVPGKAPTLAIYSYNLLLEKWEPLDMDKTLLTGSWSRTVLHPATGTLLIFGRRDSDAETDYTSRIQHHEHLMMINLQAFGLYERPIPSFSVPAQDLGQDLLRGPGLNDMHVASISGTLFDANSTILGARWPEFSSMLLSPPYVTPLILTLPVPDEVVPVFLHYLYTGALPAKTVITPGMADYLLILARRYQLNGLHALTVDLLHQSVVHNPVRIYSSALMAGELGLQARAIGLAMAALPTNGPTIAPPRPPSSSNAAPQNSDMPGLSFSDPRLAIPPRRRPSTQPRQLVDTSLSRGYSNRVPPPSIRPPQAPERHEGPRDSMSTDGGFSVVGETLLQQYNPDAANVIDGSNVSNNSQPSGTANVSSSQDVSPYTPSRSASRQRKVRSPPLPPHLQHPTSLGHPHPLSVISTGSGGSYESPVSSPIHLRGVGSGQQLYQQYQQQQQQQQHQLAYPSPLSPNSHSISSFASQGVNLRGFDVGAHSVLGFEDQDDGSSMYSGYQGQNQQHQLRAQQAKRRLQMQMQMYSDASVDPQQVEFTRQQQILLEQQQMRDEEIMLQQHQQRQQQQPKIADVEQPVVYHNSAAATMGALEYHAGGMSSYKSSKGSSGYAPSHMTVETTSETVTSQKSSNSSGKAMSVKSQGSDKDKKKGLLSKMKPPKPAASGAELMKSAGF
ncbi:hypothetical protein BX616_001542 [Lobosporangium transversale]|nr:hypothetical protein BX616_001542 [Lobosporangium transversale]